MADKWIELFGRNALQYANRQAWTGMESGISWPVPVWKEKNMALKYFIYPSSLNGKKLIVFPPTLQLVISYPNGSILEHQAFPATLPLQAAGSLPHEAAARLNPEQWQAAISDIFDLYPAVIAAYAGWAISARVSDIKYFQSLFLNTMIPPFQLNAYKNLNPDFFRWLSQV